MIKRAAVAGKDRIERLRLRGGAGIAVKDGTGILAHGGEFGIDQVGDDFVRDQFAALHHFLGLEAHRRAGLHRSAQHIAGRELAHAVPLDEPCTLRALAGTGRPKKNDVHEPSPIIAVGRCLRLVF